MVCGIIAIEKRLVPGRDDELCDVHCADMSLAGRDYSDGDAMDAMCKSLVAWMCGCGCW